MNIKRIIYEEIKSQSENFNLKETDVSKVLKELFTFSTSKLLKDLGNQDEILDEKDSLPNELWLLIIDNINNSYAEFPDEWEKELLERKKQIFSYKYFSKQELEDLDKVESKIKVEIKKYFSSLQNFISLEDFKDRFFNLPNNLLINFTRYLLNKSNLLNKKLKVNKEDIKERIKSLKEDRMKFIKKISFISNGNISSVDLTELKKLVDNGLFFEDNLLNRGVNEYIYKLINHKVASEKIVDSFNSTFLNDLRDQVEKSKSYLSHIKSIKNQESAEFFEVTGVQLGRRFDNEIEIVNKKEYDDSIIEDDSIFKEPHGRINVTGINWDDDMSTSADGESSDMSSGSSGGGFSGGSGGGGSSFSGPTGGDEVVDIEADGEPLPTGEDGFPKDFGTEETSEIGGDDIGGEDITEPDEKTTEEK